MRFSELRKKGSYSFANRLFLCIFSTSFLLLLIGELILFGSSMQASTDINRTLSMDNLAITGENLEQIFEQVDTSVQMAFAQKDVLSATQKDFNTDLAAYETIRSALRVVVTSSNYISHMSLCSDSDGVLATNGRTLEYTDATSCQAYFNSLSDSANDGGNMWYFRYQDPVRTKQENEYAFANVRVISPLVSNPKEHLLLVVSVSEKKLAKAYEFLGEDSYIMTGSGTIVSAVDAERIGDPVEPEVLNAVSKASKGVSFLFQQDNDFYYSVYLPTISCYLIVNTPATVLASTKVMMGVIAVAVMVIGLVFSLIWSNKISDTMTRPLMRLKASMEEVRSGDLTVHCEPERQDEIGYLCESFNHMLDSLNTYIKQLSEQQNLTKENEIRLLQSQINPHLLYNTLDSALYLMSSNAAEQSVQILEELSRYFKLALQQGNKIVTLDEALQHVQSYLNLQNLCRMKNFTLTVTGDSGLGKVPILHMLLQPIVENSVLHGFDGSFADGSIEIELRHSGRKVVIRVTDDGMGMEDEELQALRNRLEASAPSGQSFALWNIAQRIRMFYGPEYHVTVDSEFGEFTSVTLEIPDGFDGPEEDTHV